MTEEDMRKGYWHSGEPIVKFDPTSLSGREAVMSEFLHKRDVKTLKDALGDLLRCTEKHVFGDECKAQRDKARALVGGATSATPPPVGSIWRSATGRVYVVVNNRMASAQAGWYVWVKNRSTPFRQKEWEAARMLHTGMV